MAQNLEGLRIVTITTTLDRKAGGAGVAFALYARALRTLGANVEVWTISGGGPLLDELAADGFPNRILGLAKHSHRFSTSRALAKALAEHKPDWVHAHNYEPALHASRARKWGAIPGLIVTHHDPRLRWTRRLFNWPYRNVPDAIIVPSASGARAYQRWLRFPAERMSVLANPLPDVFFADPARDEAVAGELGLSGRYPVMAWVGRLGRLKGHADLLQAMTSIVGRYPRALLLLVGRGKLEEELHQLTNKLGLSENVRFLGHRSDGPALLALLDIFVCPSHGEVLCTAISEAMAMGKPVVSTTVWGAEDQIRHEESGLLVPIGDVRALGEAILRLADDRDFAERLGRSAEAYARDRFTGATFLDNLLRIYLGVIARRRA
jgi:glycosyltransferase involved in cell wall biosynthesis